MRVIPIGIASFFLLSATAASATQTNYDLKCEGNSSLLDGAQTGPAPFTMTLHVDLEHNLFCQNSCETREKISKVLPSNIIFRAVNTPLPNRLWIAETGQFSYTWAETRDEKPAVHSAQGFCTKVMMGVSTAGETIKQKMLASASKPPIGQKLYDQPRPEELSSREIRALFDIQNHRPIPGSMHTRLWLKGLAQLDNDLWVLTDKGEAIITGERR
jgi:hypothetical protein